MLLLKRNTDFQWQMILYLMKTWVSWIMIGGFGLSCWEDGLLPLFNDSRNIDNDFVFHTDNYETQIYDSL